MKKIFTVIMAMGIVSCLALLTGCSTPESNGTTATQPRETTAAVDIASSKADEIMSDAESIAEALTGNVELTTKENEKESKKESEKESEKESKKVSEAQKEASKKAEQ